MNGHANRAREVESKTHAMWTCKKAKGVWAKWSSSTRLLDTTY